MGLRQFRVQPIVLLQQVLQQAAALSQCFSFLGCGINQPGHIGQKLVQSVTAGVVCFVHQRASLNKRRLFHSRR